jgi:hypothetical protein
MGPIIQRSRMPESNFRATIGIMGDCSLRLTRASVRLFMFCARCFCLPFYMRKGFQALRPLRIYPMPTSLPHGFGHVGSRFTHSLENIDEFYTVGPLLSSLVNNI